MCGIAGFLVPESSITDGRERLLRMAGVLGHRGPDDHGVWFDGSAGVGLAHARLSVIDLSPEGHQPMHSASGRYSICFNGEIYNFPALRAELETRGSSFRGHSDTEVLLEGIECHGLAGMVDRCVGMFAFAVWDHHERTLSLVRDRIGIKPLYWSQSGGRLAFGSELKALVTSELISRDLDDQAVSAFLTLGYVPAPRSIFKDVQKVVPGQILVARMTDRSLEIERTSYWCSSQVARAAKSDPLEGSEDSMLDQLDDVIGTAVSDRMIADVPLGAFLSGGIDSTLVVSMMQERSAVPVKTFTIGFNEDHYDESDAARAIARHLGTDHTELIVTPDDLLSVVPMIPDLFDEPFADSSQIPTFLVSKLARSQVTVSLTGDGGDELFGGYNRYLAGVQIFNRIRHLPQPGLNLLSAGILGVPVEAWDRLFGVMRPASFGRLKKRPFGASMHKLGQVIRAEGPLEYYQTTVALWPDASVVYPRVPSTSWLDSDAFADDLAFSEQMFLADTRGYLVDDILVKVDRTSMGVSLEARVPLLDHRVYEMAWRLPMSLRLDGGQGKVALRRLLARRMPRDLYERPKMGFGVPIADWLRSELRDWADALLQPADLESMGLDADLVRATWDRFLRSDRMLSRKIWTVLMLRTWYDRWGTS
ncbi:MAG: asparagine synthase (glutamine-hydrolyzing) [Planctomycetota bacterium]|nr:asparagine synthase (glutamine-hydrolyzing) [Planctomycetota bacterium]